MSTSISSPVELALSSVLHEVAGGASAEATLRLVARAGQQAMGVTTGCAVVLGEPGVGLVVRARSTSGDARPDAPEQLLTTGPVQVTASSGAVSTVEDARAPNARWAPWVDAARSAGVVGVRCWPVRVDGRPIGALVVLTADPWSAPVAPGRPGLSSATGQALADVCSVGLQLPAPPQRWAQVLLHLHTSLDLDVVVHQAIGMVAAAGEVDVVTAATALTAHAERIGADVVDLARRVVSREVAASDITRP